jgi:hypothetical protein
MESSSSSSSSSKFIATEENTELTFQEIIDAEVEKRMHGFKEKFVNVYCIAKTNDKDNRYCMKDTSIIDETSFVLLDSMYAHDTNNIYFLAPIKEHTTFSKIISLEEVDRESFEVLQQEKVGKNSYLSGLAKDKNLVYFKGHEISSSDPFSFEILSLGFALDNNNLYYFQTALINSTPIEKQYTTFPHESHCKIFVINNLKNFEKICLDNENEVFEESKYEKLNDLYAKYDNAPYFFENEFITLKGFGGQFTEKTLHEIPRIDKETFELIEYPYVKDKNNKYHKGEIVE